LVTRGGRGEEEAGVDLEEGCLFSRPAAENGLGEKGREKGTDRNTSFHFLGEEKKREMTRNQNVPHRFSPLQEMKVEKKKREGEV